MTGLDHTHTFGQRHLLQVERDLLNDAMEEVEQRWREAAEVVLSCHSRSKQPMVQHTLIGVFMKKRGE